MAYITADQAIPGHNSKAEDWISWYEMIPGGKSTRNPIWLQAWAKWGGGAANTVGLRDYMRKNAGIEITTSGVGSIVDATLGIKDSLESALMIPVYGLAIGGVIFVGMSGFMVYQAFKNPDAAGRIIGSATKVAMLADGGPLSSKRNLWLMGAGATVLVSLIVVFYLRYQNQLVVNNIMEALKKTPDPILGSGAGSYGDTRDLNNSQIFNPSYWRSVPSSVTLPVNQAIALSTQIWEAKSTSDLTRLQVRDYPEKVVAAFKALKTKADVSKLSDVFEGQHKTSLINFINDSFMTNNCSSDQNSCYFGVATNYLKQVYDWVTTQLA